MRGAAPAALLLGTLALAACGVKAPPRPPAARDSVAPSSAPSTPVAPDGGTPCQSGDGGCGR